MHDDDDDDGGGDTEGLVVSTVVRGSSMIQRLVLLTITGLKM